MYDFILTERLLTASAAVILVLLVSTFVGARSLWLRGLLYSFTPAMAAAFYTVAFTAPIAPDSLDLVAGMLFEITVLAIFFQYFKKLSLSVSGIGVQDSVVVLRWTLLGLVVIFMLNFTAAGFGIFSEGSRIDYLSTSPLQKYYTYAGIMLISVQAVFLASLISNRGYVGYFGWLVIALNFSYSVVSGSKGGVILWLVSVASLIDYKKANIKIGRIVIALVLLGISSWISIQIVSDYMSLDTDSFLELATSRFFLVNDARALALDLRSSQTSGISFFNEAFRSLANILGEPPVNDPLGVALYRLQQSTEDGSGANASFMALVTYYFPIGYSLVPALIGAAAAIGIGYIGMLLVRTTPSPTMRLIITAIWLPCMLIYSQDFLAFQTIFPLAVLVVMFITAYQLFIAKNRNSKVPSRAGSRF